MRFRYNLDMDSSFKLYLAWTSDKKQRWEKDGKDVFAGSAEDFFFLFFLGGGMVCPHIPRHWANVMEGAKTWTCKCTSRIHSPLIFFAANAWWHKTCTFWFLTCPVSSLYVDTKSLGELRVAQKHQIPCLVSTFLWRRGVSYVIWRKSIKSMDPQDLCHRYLVYIYIYSGIEWAG